MDPAAGVEPAPPPWRRPPPLTLSDSCSRFRRSTSSTFAPSVSAAASLRGWPRGVSTQDIVWWPCASAQPHLDCMRPPFEAEATCGAARGAANSRPGAPRAPRATAPRISCCRHARWRPQLALTAMCDARCSAKLLRYRAARELWCSREKSRAAKEKRMLAEQVQFSSESRIDHACDSICVLATRLAAPPQLAAGLAGLSRRSSQSAHTTEAAQHARNTRQQQQPCAAHPAGRRRSAPRVPGAPPPRAAAAAAASSNPAGR